MIFELLAKISALSFEFLSKKTNHPIPPLGTNNINYQLQWKAEHIPK